MTEPARQHTHESAPTRVGLTGPVLWSGIAWLAVATFGLVPTAMLFARGVMAMIGFMVGMALVALPLYSVFELWHTRTVRTAVRSAMSSFGLTALAFAMWAGGRGIEPILVGVCALLVVPGVLSLFAARQLHIESRPRRGAAERAVEDAEPVSPAEVAVIVLLLVVVLGAAFLLLEPTFSEPFRP